MRTLFNLNVLLVVILSVIQVTHAEGETYPQAIAAAEQWLKMVDAGQYDQSWEIASQLVKDAVSKEQWSKSIAGARGSFGPVVSRALKSKQYANSLPGVPDGEYVVILYQTSFKNKKLAIETITPKRTADGSWRVAGYYIR